MSPGQKIAYGYKLNEGAVVRPGAEALGLTDVVVGQQTYALQGTLSDIRNFLKDNKQKKLIGKSCDPQTGQWAQGPETIKIKIYDVSTAPMTAEQWGMGKCAVDMVQKGALTAAGEVCDAVAMFTSVAKKYSFVNQLLRKKITVEIDTYVQAEWKGRGVYRVIDTNSTALAWTLNEPYSLHRRVHKGAMQVAQKSLHQCGQDAEPGNNTAL